MKLIKICKKLKNFAIKKFSFYIIYVHYEIQTFIFICVKVGMMAYADWNK